MRLLICTLLLVGCSENQCQLTDGGNGTWDAVNCKKVSTTYFPALRNRGPMVEVIAHDPEGVEVCTPSGFDYLCELSPIPHVVRRFSPVPKGPKYGNKGGP